MNRASSVALTKLALVAAAATWMFSCGSELPTEPEFDNPLDPESPTGVYEAPETTILTGPDEAAIIDSHTVAFTWSGNDLVVAYSYRLTGEDWSPWSADTSVILDYLDEGAYTFEVKGRYISTEEDATPASRSFTINDIPGPALWFAPRKVQVAAGGQFTVSLMAEEVTDMKAVFAKVEFDFAQLEMTNYLLLNQAGQFLTQHNATVIALVDSALASGVIAFNMALAGGDQLGVAGSGAMVELTFTRIAGSATQIGFGAVSRMIGADLAEIALNELAPAMVVAP